MKLIPIHNQKMCASPAGVFLQCLAWLILMIGIALAYLQASSAASLPLSVFSFGWKTSPGFDWPMFVLILIPSLLVFSAFLCLAELFENTARIARSLEGFRLEDAAPASESDSRETETAKEDA